MPLPAAFGVGNKFEKEAFCRCFLCAWNGKLQRNWQWDAGEKNAEVISTSCHVAWWRNSLSAGIRWSNAISSAQHAFKYMAPVPAAAWGRYDHRLTKIKSTATFKIRPITVVIIKQIASSSYLTFQPVNFIYSGSEMWYTCWLLIQ